MFNSTPCASCGTEISPGLLACPGCHRLVHADRLKELAAEAGQAERDGDVQRSLVAWREALDLIPQGSKQYEQVAGRISALGRQADAPPATAAATTPGVETTGGEQGSWSGKAGVAGI